LPVKNLNTFLTALCRRNRLYVELLKENPEWGTAAPERVNAGSFDHIVGAGDQRQRHSEA
jgi:hypothetical protein